MSYSREFLIQQFKKAVRNYMPIASAAETLINHKLSQLDESDWATIENFFNSFTFPLHVYRGLRINSEQEVNFKNPGNNWTVDTALFHAPFSAFRGSNYILEGDVNEDQIDWPETVQNFMYYSVNAARNQRYPENEVTLKKGQIPSNLTGSMKESLTEDVSTPDKPSAQDKFRYYWEIESRAIKNPEDLLRKFKLKYPNQYDIWGEIFEWMLENNKESFIEPQNFALYLEYDPELNWGYIALVEFKTRYQESIKEATFDITTRLNNILDKIDPSKLTQDDYEAAIYDKVANELRPAGYNNDAIEKVVDTYIAQKQERLQPLSEVYPQKNETKSDFINRFMRVTAKEYPDVKQRYAVANSYWDRRDLNEAYLDPEEKFWDYKTKAIEPGQYIDTTRNEIRWVDDMLEDPSYYEKKGYTARIIDMSPEQYFEECAKLFGNSVDAQKRQIAADTGVLDNLTQVIKKYNKRFPIPFINIKDRTQEGRHRMYVLGELFGWDKKVPVLIIQDVNNVRVPGKPIR